MYISYEHQFVQIAVPRTASVSSCAAIRQSDITHSSDVFYSVPEQQGGEFPKSDSLLFGRNLSFFVEELGMSQDCLKSQPSYTGNELGKAVSLKLSEELKKSILLHHLTPSHLLTLGLLTSEQLENFNLFGFVRDPIERWVSRTFLSMQLAGITENKLEILTDFIRSGKFSRSDTASNIVASKMKDYFFHEGTQVVTPYRYSNMETVVSDFIASKGGTRPDPFPTVGVINVIPEEFRAPVAGWMPSDCLTALQEHYAEDINFYNSVES